ncbi:MAG: hypothetical protein WBD90_12525 [Xanthobacteraceae bacterium]
MAPSAKARIRRWVEQSNDTETLPLRFAPVKIILPDGTHEIAAITGHATLAEVERYTKAANRKRLGASAMKRLIEDGA